MIVVTATMTVAVTHVDTMRSFFAQQDHLEVVKHVKDWPNFMNI